MRADCCTCETGMAHQAEGAEEVIIEAHQVHLPDGSQGLLLRQLTGPRAETQALCSHANSATAHNHHPACIHCLVKPAMQTPFNKRKTSIAWARPVSRLDGSRRGRLTGMRIEVLNTV